MAVQSEIQTHSTVDLSSLLGQKKVSPGDAPRVLYQCADCEVLFDALSLWQQHRKMGCCLETGPGPGVAQPQYETVQGQLADEQMVVKEEQGQPDVITSQPHVTVLEVSQGVAEPEVSQQELPSNSEPTKPPETPAPQTDISAVHLPADQSPPRRRRQKKDKPPSNLLCVECGQSFSQVSELVTHRRVQHSLKDAIHRCTVCGEGFINTTLFLYHRRQHRSEMENEPKEVSPTVPQLSTALLEASGEGLLLLATAGEGQSLMELTTLDQTITETPAAHVEVELDSNEIREEEVLQSDQEPVLEDTMKEQNSEVMVEKIVELVEEDAGVNEEERMEVVTVQIEGQHCEEMEVERVEAEKAVVEKNQGEAESNATQEPVSTSSGNEGQKFLCHQCGSCLTSEQELAKHRKAEHGLIPALHTCTECGAEFMSTTQFLYHRREHRKNPLAGQLPTAGETCKFYPTSAVSSVVKCRDGMLPKQPGQTECNNTD